MASEKKAGRALRGGDDIGLIGDQSNIIVTLRTPLVVGEAYGLFLLLTTKSQFATGLYNQMKAMNATISTVNAYFLNTLAGQPFNLNISKIDITKFQPLWTDYLGNLALQLDQTPLHVGKALTPDIPYDSPPCPDTGTQTALWHTLTGL